MIKVNGKLQQPNLRRTTNGPYSSRKEVQISPSSKELWAAEVLAEDKGNMEWVVEEGSEL